MATIRLFGGADAGGASEALQVGEQLLFEFESVEIVVTRAETELKQTGRLNLTSQQIKFFAGYGVAETAGAIQNCAFPVPLIENGRYEQPLFWGTNNFSFTVAAGGPSADGLAVVINFNNGGGDGFMSEWGHLAARRAVQRAPAAPVDRPEERAAQAARQAEVAAAVEGVFGGSAQASTAAAYYSDNSDGHLIVPDATAPPSGYNKKNT